MILGTIKREEFDKIMKQLNVKRPVFCMFCGKKITKDNFALIKKSIISCDNSFCLEMAVNLSEINDVMNKINGK